MGPSPGPRARRAKANSNLKLLQRAARGSADPPVLPSSRPCQCGHARRAPDRRPRAPSSTVGCRGQRRVRMTSADVECCILLPSPGVQPVSGQGRAGTRHTAWGGTCACGAAGNAPRARVNEPPRSRAAACPPPLARTDSGSSRAHRGGATARRDPYSHVRAWGRLANGFWCAGSAPAAAGRGTIGGGAEGWAEVVSRRGLGPARRTRADAPVRVRARRHAGRAGRRIARGT